MIELPDKRPCTPEEALQTMVDEIDRLSQTLTRREEQFRKYVQAHNMERKGYRMLEETVDRLQKQVVIAESKLGLLNDFYASDEDGIINSDEKRAVTQLIDSQKENADLREGLRKLEWILEDENDDAQPYVCPVCRNCNPDDPYREEFLKEFRGPQARLLAGETFRRQEMKTMPKDASETSFTILTKRDCAFLCHGGCKWKFTGNGEVHCSLFDEYLNENGSTLRCQQCMKAEMDL